MKTHKHMGRKGESPWTGERSVPLFHCDILVTGETVNYSFSEGAWNARITPAEGRPIDPSVCRVVEARLKELAAQRK